jgi:stage II sporulation protein D
LQRGAGATCFLKEKHPGESYELCNDDDCQRYHGLTFADTESLNTALETRGEYLIDSSDEVVPAYYSKCCGGISESAQDCFGFESPCLQSVTDGEQPTSALPLEKWVHPSQEQQNSLYCGGDRELLHKNLGGVDDAGEYFRWQHQEKKVDLAHYLNTKSEIQDAEEVLALTPTRRGSSGRIHELEIIYRTTNGERKAYRCTSQYEVRKLLHPSFLYSSAITLQEEGDSFIFHGAGWGHGVGLCQIGATFQAIKGRSYQEILKLYFPGSEIVKV